MSKYIIEIPDDVQYVLLNGKADHKYYTAVHPIANLEELNSDYINEHFGDLQDDAYERGHGIGYQKGFEDGKKSYDKAYQHGLDDAWEAAKKMFSSMTDSDIEKAFPNEWNNGGFGALMNLRPQEAIEKLKAYEKQKADDEIKVGDEMRQVTNSGAPTGLVCTVTAFDGEKMCGFSQDGLLVVCSSQVNRWWKKTGRHFDIDKILEEMRS